MGEFSPCWRQRHCPRRCSFPARRPSTPAAPGGACSAAPKPRQGRPEGRPEGAPAPAPTAQQAPPPGGWRSAAPAPSPPDQQVQLIYAPWTKFCLKGQDAGAKQVCFTGKDGRIESGQPVIAAVIIEPEGEPKKILRVTLPLGMQLVHGTRIIVDSNPPAAEPLCDLLRQWLHVGLRSDAGTARQHEEGPEPRGAGDQLQRRAADAAAAAARRIRQGL